MSTDDHQPELGYRVLRSIRQIIHHVSSHSKTMSRQSGLTVPQLLCLRSIQEGDDPINVADVADAVHMSRPTVSGVIDRLVQRGLVERSRSVRDRRRVELTLTEVGQAKLAETPKPLQGRFLTRLGGLEEAEQERLLSALEQLVGLMVDEP